jgi:hypothetical protein
MGAAIEANQREEVQAPPKRAFLCLEGAALEPSFVFFGGQSIRKSGVAAHLLRRVGRVHLEPLPLQQLLVAACTGQRRRSGGGIENIKGMSLAEWRRRLGACRAPAACGRPAAATSAEAGSRPARQGASGRRRVRAALGPGAATSGRREEPAGSRRERARGETTASRRRKKTPLPLVALGRALTQRTQRAVYAAHGAGGQQGGLAPLQPRHVALARSELGGEGRRRTRVGDGANKGGDATAGRGSQRVPA